MKSKKLNTKKSKAQAMVEFALALPVLLLLLYGILEAGRLIFMYSAIVNASRQAVRYGATTGTGNGTGNPSEPRFQDCDGIRKIAQDLAYITTFYDTDITIYRDTGPGTAKTPYCAAGMQTDPSFTKPGDNNNRITVEIKKQFVPILPKLVPFVTRDIIATSSRTILISIDIVVTPAIVKAPTVTTITTDNPDASTEGNAVNVTVTVTGGATPPTGQVNITGADVNCAITLVGGAGSCNVTFSTAGSRLLTASYVGDLTHNASIDTEPHKVLSATVLTITADNPDPSLINQAVTVSISLTSGSVAFTGTQQVAITGANTNCTITINNGTGLGSCNVNFTSSGIKTLVATYSGDTDHASSTASAKHYSLTNNNDTITEITSHTPDPSVINSSVTVSVQVISIVVPTGTVTIGGANTNCTVTLANGAGSCNVIFTTPGAKTISATYNPDASHTGSSTSAGHTVALPATVTTITADTPDPSEVGGAVTVTVTVAGVSTIPTGTVTITGADTNCTITLLSGTGSCSVVFTSGGSKILSAQYSGDSLNAASKGDAPHIVNYPIGPTPVPSCNAVTHGALTRSGNTMSMTITNPYSFPLTTGAGTVTWNDDKGHQTGSDKSLILQSIVIGTTTVWSGASSNVSTIPFNTPVVIPATITPPNTTITITLTFHQSYDTPDGTEKIYINLTTPGCESTPIQS